MHAPNGAHVRLYYDWDGPPPAPREGDYIRSSAGTVYEIVELHASKRIAGRVNVVCLKHGRAALPPAHARVWPLYWYPRRRRRQYC